MNLPITEELDFAYLLELMSPLHNVNGFSWLPELFSIIGHEKFITLCQYAGGSTITIPTLDQLSNSISALQWYYDIYIKKQKILTDAPENLIPLIKTIQETYNDA